MSDPTTLDSAVAAVEQGLSAVVQEVKDLIHGGEEVAQVVEKEPAVEQEVAEVLTLVQQLAALPTEVQAVVRTTALYLFDGFNGVSISEGLRRLEEISCSVSGGDKTS